MVEHLRVTARFPIAIFTFWIGRLDDKCWTQIMGIGVASARFFS